MVEEARKALAEGREVNLPSIGLPAGASLPKLSNTKPSSRSFEALEIDPLFAPPLPTAGEDLKTGNNKRQFGLSPEKALAVPAHLRTSSIQVEPATPPKWMIEEEAEDLAHRVTQPQARVSYNDEPAKRELAKGEEKDKVVEKRSSMEMMGQVFLRKGPKKDRPTGTSHGSVCR